MRRACDLVEVVPGISSVQVACARAGLAMEDVVFITLHVREGAEAGLWELCEVLQAARRDAIVLPRPWDLMPPALSRRLVEHRIDGARPVIVFERLTLEGEREHRLTLGELAASDREFSDLSIVVLPRLGGGQGR